MTFSQMALSRRAQQLSNVNKQLQEEMQERRKTEEALRQSHKMEALGQLSGGVAHDFNNILAVINSSLHLLEKRLSQGQVDVQRYLDTAYESISRAARLTQRILAFARRQPLEAQTVELRTLVKGMHELISHSVGSHVSTEYRLDSKWTTLCDPNQMENVILNLAINARDAMPTGGQLTITTDDSQFDTNVGGFDEFRPGEYVQLQVSDTGTGMSDEVRRKAFDPFFTTKPVGEGTGLGLSTTFGFIKQSNGFMKIDSELGKGATITILMPRVA
jgi:signal transduction histidine kinase